MDDVARRLNETIAAGALHTALTSAGVVQSADLLRDRDGIARPALYVRFHLLRSRYRVTVTMDQPEGEADPPDVTGTLDGGGDIDDFDDEMGADLAALDAYDDAAAALDDGPVERTYRPWWRR